MPSFDRLIDDYAFSVQLQWFPASGMYDIWQGGGLSDLLHHLVLPAVTLSLVATGDSAFDAHSNVRGTAT